MIIFKNPQPQDIDWESDDSYILMNPRAPFAHNEILHDHLKDIIKKDNLKSHIFLMTSGSTAVTTQHFKWVALAKSAILISSQAVNEHLCSTKSDLILNPLPFFHIGGLSVYSRTYLSGAKSVNTYSDTLKWDPFQFVKDLSLHGATLTSLVPTHVFDLVNAKLTAPGSLRYSVVGGGTLDKNIFLKAQNLGWNLLPSYGMTECCSQIATASPGFHWETESPPLKVLPHLTVTLNDDGIIHVSGKSLLTGYITFNEASLSSHDTESFSFFNPVEEGSLRTADCGYFSDHSLFIHGRIDDTVKVGGETVSLKRLDGILENIKMQAHFSGDIALFPMEDDRLGRKICLAAASTENKELVNKIVTLFNKEVFPFEKVRDSYFIPFIPRTELGKLKRAALAHELLLWKNN